MAGSDVHQRADQASGGQESSDGWTVVKRRGGRKAKQQSTPTVNPATAGGIGGLIESPPGSQPMPAPVQGTGLTEGPVSGAPTGPTRTRQHLSRRQRRRMQREKAKQEQQASVAMRPTLQPTQESRCGEESPAGCSTGRMPHGPTAHMPRQVADRSDGQAAPPERRMVPILRHKL